MNVIVIGGKTAGHINPAIALITELEDRNHKVYYFGIKNSLEEKLINKDIFVPLNFYGTTKNPFKIVFLIYLFIKNYFFTKRFIKNNKIELVISTGGNLSLPIFYAAKSLNIKKVIHEQNIILGRSNKLLLKNTDKLFISFNKKFKKYPENKQKYLGNPATSLLDLSNQKSSINYPKNYKRILITTGSIGSKVVNEKIKELLNLIMDENYFLVWITGTKYYNAYENLNSEKIYILPYTLQMPELLKEADLVISRAGASTLSEIIHLEKPSIIIPSPNVLNNHQEYNCNYLYDEHACIKINEIDLTALLLYKSIKKAFVLKDNLKFNLRKFKVENSSKKIIDETMKLFNYNNN